MSNIIDDYKKINFQKAAIAFIMPDGKVLSINKIKGLDYHMDYLKILAKSNKEIKKLTVAVDLDYYRSNPSEIMYGVWPLFSMANIVVYTNLMPNSVEPTEVGVLYLPEKPTKLTMNTLKKMDKQLEDVIFMGIGHYYNNDGIYELTENETFDRFNSNDIADIINENKPKEKTI